TSPPGPFVASPTFSPDGKYLAFVQGLSYLAHDIYLAPVAGGEPRRLTRDNGIIGGLTWTSNGREIVFSSNRGGLYNLWHVSASGGAPEPLSAVGEDAFQPAVSRRETTSPTYGDEGTSTSGTQRGPTGQVQQVLRPS